MSAQQPYQPWRNAWNAAVQLQPIARHQVPLSTQQREYFSDFFWHDLCAEWDSHNLYHEIHRRHARQAFSPEFMRFHEAWYLDEQNHATGFMRLLNWISGEAAPDLVQRLKSRPTDFRFLEEFFDDEFKLCVLFAYDEYATLQTFRKDTFYKDFGSPCFEEWIRRVRTDEAIHFGNVVRLLHYRYAERLQEAPQVIAQIVQIEQNLDAYHGTFLFDHDGSHFLLTEEELVGKCATTVLRKILKNPHASLAPHVAV